MSTRRIQHILIGLIFFAGSVFLLMDVLGRHSASATIAKPAPPPFLVVQTARPLTRGSVIRRDDVVLRPSQNLPPKGAVTDVADAIERISLRNIRSSEIISDSNSVVAAKGVTLSSLIPPGLRAVALHVVDDAAVANLIRPGDKVDLLVVSNAARTPQAENRVFPLAAAITILQNIPVLAIGATTVGNGSGISANREVTLAVTAQQAAKVALLRAVGSEFLSLRAVGDDEDVAIPAITSEDLFPTKAERVTQATPPPSRPTALAPQQMVEIISGTSDKVSKVPSERVR